MGPTSSKMTRWPAFLVLPVVYWLVRSFAMTYPAWASAVIPETWWTVLGGPALGTLLMALLIPMFLKRDGVSSEGPGFSARMGVRDWACGLMGGLVLWLLQDRLLAFGQAATGGAPINVGENTAIGVLGTAGLLQFLGIFLDTAVRAPLMEEVLYRGCLISAMRARWGGSRRRLVAYAVVSAAVFAVFHRLGDPRYYAVYFVTGLGLAGIYLEGGSLGSAVLAHGVINGIYVLRSFR